MRLNEVASAGLLALFLFGIILGWGNSPEIDKAVGVDREKTIVVEKPCPVEEHKSWWKFF